MTSDIKSKHTKEFIDLQNVWYAKLSQEGFHDLEHLDKNTGLGHSSPFLRHPLTKFKHLDAAELSATSNYFLLATTFLHEHDFQSRLHRFTWQLYCDGISYRKMIKRIYSRGFKHVPSVFWISTHINKLQKSFELWQSKQPSEDSAPESSYKALQTFMESNDVIN